MSSGRNLMARCYVIAGITPKDVVQITPSFGLFNGGFGFHYGAEKLGAMIVPCGAGRSMLQLRFLRDFKVDCLTAISSYPLRLIEVAEKEQFDFDKLKLRVGIFGAEVWSDEIRARIEEKMGIETFDIIGMTETGGVGLGIDCAEHSGIHVWEDDYLVEIINPDTGEVVPDGEIGRDGCYDPQPGRASPDTLSNQGHYLHHQPRTLCLWKNLPAYRPAHGEK